MGGMNNVFPIRMDNPLGLLNESTELMDYSEGGLASQVFSLVDSKMMTERKEIMSSLVGSSPAMSEIVNGMSKDCRLKLEFSDDVKQKIADGTYKLMQKKDADNLYKAVVVDSNNKIRAIADLKWEEVVKGVDPTAVTMAMQGMAIQQQLRVVSEQLESMSESMSEILRGQHNDRLALYYTGEAIYREALATSDPERRKQLSSNAIYALTNAVTSLATTLAFEITDLCGKYNEEKGSFQGIKVEKIKEKMFQINSSFQTIHKASTLKAAIYYKEGEYGAMTAVLQDYKFFLERSLTESNARILYLADPNEKSINGTWDIRSNQLPKRIDSIQELLESTEKYAIEVGMEDIA